MSSRYSGEFAAARETAQRIGSPYDRLLSLVDVASKQGEAGQRDPAQKVLDEILPQALPLKEKDRLHAIKRIVCAYADIGNYDLCRTGDIGCR